MGDSVVVVVAVAYDVDVVAIVVGGCVVVAGDVGADVGVVTGVPVVVAAYLIRINFRADKFYVLVGVIG